MGVTGAHTLVGGADHLGAHERHFDSGEAEKQRTIRVQQFRLKSVTRVELNKIYTAK